MAGKPPKREPFWRRLTSVLTPEAVEARRKRRAAEEALRAAQTRQHELNALRVEIGTALNGQGLRGIQMRGAIDEVLRFIDAGMRQEDAISHVSRERQKP